MDPLPEPFSLLPAILQRIEQAMDHHLRFAVPENAFGDIAARKIRQQQLVEHQGLYERLHRLYSDFTLAWDSNVARRQGALDPDYYAAEVKRTNSARLSLNSRLTKFLKDVSERMYRSDGKTLFVVTIDDFDMHPTSALHVLKMLRMLSAHRLFFLMLGDIELLELMTDLSVSREVTGLLNPNLSEKVLGVEMEDIGRANGSIARTTLRKPLPTSQRFFVSPPTIPEGMRFRPASLNQQQSEDSKSPMIASLFANIPMPMDLGYQIENHMSTTSGFAVPTLLDYLVHPGFSVLSDSGSAKRESSKKKYHFIDEIQYSGPLDDHPGFARRDKYQAYFSSFHYALNENGEGDNLRHAPRLVLSEDWQKVRSELTGDGSVNRKYDHLARIPISLLSTDSELNGKFLSLPADDKINADLRKQIIKNLDFELKRNCFWGLHIFETNPRHLADLWFALRSHVDRVSRAFLPENLSLSSGNSSGGVDQYAVDRENDRKIADTLETLEQLLHQQFARTCRDLLLEEPAFHPTQRDRIVSALTPSLIGDFNWSDLPVRLVSIPQRTIVIPGESWARNRVRVPITDKQNPEEQAKVTRNLYHEFRVCEIEDWSMVAASIPRDAYDRRRDPKVKLETQTSEHIDPSRELSSHSASLLMIFHDMLRLGRQVERFVSDLVPQGDGTLSLAHQSTTTRRPGETLKDVVGREIWCHWAGTRYKGSYRNYADLYWPPPTVLSVWGLDMFRRCWNETVSIASNEGKTDKAKVELMAFGWISAGCAVTASTRPVEIDIRDNKKRRVEHRLRDDSPNVHQKDDDCEPDRSHGPHDDDWACLWTRLNQIAHDYYNLRAKPHTPEVDQHRHWLENVAVMLMPESGLPSRLMFHVLFGLPVEPVGDPVYIGHLSHAQINRRECLHYSAQLLAALYKTTRNLHVDSWQFKSIYVLDGKNESSPLADHLWKCKDYQGPVGRRSTFAAEPQSLNDLAHQFLRTNKPIVNHIAGGIVHSHDSHYVSAKDVTEHAGFASAVICWALREALPTDLKTELPTGKVMSKSDFEACVDAFSNVGVDVDAKGAGSQWSIRQLLPAIGSWLRGFPYVRFLEDFKTETRARRGVRLALLDSIAKGELKNRLRRSHCIQISSNSGHSEIASMISKEYSLDPDEAGTRLKDSDELRGVARKSEAEASSKRLEPAKNEGDNSPASGQEFAKSVFTLGFVLTGGGLVPHDDEIQPLSEEHMDEEQRIAKALEAIPNALGPLSAITKTSS